jgi:hypothetical protein
MKLKKKAEIKDTSNFKDMDLFKNEEGENSENEEAPEEEEDEDQNTPKFHRLHWVTTTNLYDSAIKVKEINIFN